MKVAKVNKDIYFVDNGYRHEYFNENGMIFQITCCVELKVELYVSMLTIEEGEVLGKAIKRYKRTKYYKLAKKKEKERGIK